MYKALPKLDICASIRVLGYSFFPVLCQRRFVQISFSARMGFI